MSVTTTLFKSNQTQAMRLPRDVAFPETVREVTILREGNRRIIVPKDQSWDDFFDQPGTDFPDRDQPAMQERESF